MSGSNTNLVVAQPLPSSPIVDLSTGNLTSPWLNFLSSLYVRTGSGPGPGQPAQDTTQTAQLAALAEGTDSDGIDARSAANAAVLAALGDVQDAPGDPLQASILEGVPDAPGDPLLASLMDDPSDDALAPLNGVWVSTAGVVTAAAGTITTASAAVRYKKVGRVVFINILAAITTNGTGATAVIVTLPFVSSAAGIYCLSGREQNVTGVSLCGYINASSGTVSVVKYDNSYPAANGYLLALTGVYESAT